MKTLNTIISTFFFLLFYVLHVEFLEQLVLSPINLDCNRESCSGGVINMLKAR
jgi:hypothetical protein